MNEDRVFVTTLARSDMRRHRLHLRELVKRRYPDTPLDLVGFTMDYTQGAPPSYTSFLVYELDAVAHGTRIMKRSVIERAQTNGPRKHTILARVLYPHVLGKTAQEIFITDTYDEGTSSEYPRLKPGRKQTEKRASGRFVDFDVPLEACFDEVDELMCSMRTYAAEDPNLMRDPNKLVELGFQERANVSTFEQVSRLHSIVSQYVN